jgi:uncharacterized protein (TIGR03083 family)
MTKIDQPNSRLRLLNSSAERLRTVAGKLDDTELIAQAYPAKWTIADVLSHLGSGAVIMQRTLEDGLVEQPTPDNFASGVWATWNAKSPRSQADDALAEDRSLLKRLDSLTSAERSRFRFALGPMSFDFEDFIGLRLNEHAMHTWDIEVVADPEAVLPADATADIVDNLELIARFTAKPTGSSRVIAVRTSEPTRDFVITFEPDKVTLATGDGGQQPDLELPAEAFARLAYGRLDPAHTPASVSGDAGAVEELRRAFPGP